MSKEICLYSDDKKYKCVVELSDSLDQFKCPDHSVLILFEERENGTYIIAQSRDKRLETEKDQQIANLEVKLAEKEQQVEKWKQFYNIAIEDFNEMQEANNKLKQQLAEKEREIKYLEKEVDDWCHKIMQQGTHHSLELSKAREKANQDKISFALEHINQFKDFILNNIYLTNNGDEEKVNKFANEIIENIKGK